MLSQSNLEFYYAVNQKYPDFIITLWLYECEMLSAFRLKEHESYRWFSPKELNAEEWAPADAEIVNGIKRVFGEI